MVIIQNHEQPVRINGAPVWFMTLVLQGFRVCKGLRRASSPALVLRGGDGGRRRRRTEALVGYNLTFLL